MTYPCVGITRIRFHGYNLSLNTCPSTPRIDRKGKQKSGKCQTSAAFFALFNSTLASMKLFCWYNSKHKDTKKQSIFRLRKIQ